METSRMEETAAWPTVVTADRAGIAAAAAILRRGGLAALPTETVYGLAGDATSEAAVARIYAAKARPSHNPLIAHVASLDAALEEGDFSREALLLARGFWPGPLTLVVPLSVRASVCPAARAGQATIALRVPSHPVALATLRATGRALAMPSANRSGRVSPVTADHVARDLGPGVDLIVDGGRCPVGVESTVIECLDVPRLLRPGGLTRGEIEEVLGHELFAAKEAAAGGMLRSPGLLRSHYAPRARLRLEATSLHEGEAGLDFGAVFGSGKNVRDLSPGRDLAEAAANLFSYLRELDAGNPGVIAVAPIPRDGLGEAINDRLARAAAPRQ